MPCGVITGIDPVPFVKGAGCRGYPKKKEAEFIAAGKIKPWSIDAKARRMWPIMMCLDTPVHNILGVKQRCVPLQ